MAGEEGPDSKVISLDSRRPRFPNLIPVYSSKNSLTRHSIFSLLRVSHSQTTSTR